MSNKAKNLFSEFPPVSTEEWEKVIKKDLNGADYKEKLKWETGEGVKILPFYRREDLADLTSNAPISKKYTDGSANSWEIREPVFANTIRAANKSARRGLEGGARALQIPLSIRRAEGMLGGDLQGVPIQDQHDFSELFQNISIQDTTLHFDAGLASPALLAMLWNETKDQNLNRDEVGATFSYDPFVFILERGYYPKKKEMLERDIIQLTECTTRNLPAVRPLCVDARAYHNMGGTIVQELGYALAAASEYFSILTDEGFSTEQIANSLHFSFSIGSNYFLEIAKFRAARILWKNLIGAFGENAKDTGPYLHGETSRWNKTLYDPYTNMLRTSTEGMSAAIAGCDSITILPFDRHFRQPDEFSRRIARNQQIILSEEAYMDKVEDPAAGSYYIEKLTDAIGQEAWNIFREVEAQGGIFKAIEQGTIQSAIKDSQESKDRAIACRGRIFVGTNQYSNAEDEMTGRIDSQYQTVSLEESEESEEGVRPEDIQNLPEDLAKALSNGAKLGDVVSCLFSYGKHQFRTVQPYRGTQAFEELRLATGKHETTPTVLTLPMGSKKMRKARSAFTSNFFGCAGYHIEDPVGFDSVGEAVSAVKEQQPEIVVLCSSDKEYKQFVPALCNRLNELDKQPVTVLAGYPKGHIEEYKEAGIDEFIHARCNVLETLTNFQQKLGIEV